MDSASISAAQSHNRRLNSGVLTVAKEQAF